MCSTTSRADLEENFVDGFSLGNRAIDYFAVNVIIDHDVLRRTSFFVGTGYIERRQPSQYAEDMGGDFQHVSIHATLPPAFHSNLSLIAEIATNGGSKPQGKRFDVASTEC